MTRSTLIFGTAVFAALGLSPVAGRAAGPCSDDIASLGKQLGSMHGLGAPVSEPSAGQSQGMSQQANASSGGSSGASSSDHDQSGGASKTAGGSAGTVGGVAGAVGSVTGSKSQDAVASGQVATSAADVRRQSEGKPTMAQQAATGSSSADTTNDDKASQAKMALQRAVDLNAKGDNSCAAAVKEARNLMPSH